MKVRALILSGFGSVGLAIALLLFGNPSAAVFSFVFLALGAALLLVGLVRAKRNEGSERYPPSDARRADRVIWIALATLAGLAVVAAIVAATVAIGEATGHAVGHLVVGLACLVLFAGVAGAWHPRPGSGKASIRGIVLLVLGVGAFGSFIESLGGAGYDAANLERRIASLASLHGIGVLLGPVALLAIPLGCVTLLLVTCSAVATRWRRI
jgi:hypothetical protein